MALGRIIKILPTNSLLSLFPILKQFQILSVFTNRFFFFLSNCLSWFITTIFTLQGDIMKKLFIIAMGIIFSASMASAFDVKGNALGAASDFSSGKSAKDIAEAKKKEAVDAAKAEAEKKKKEAIDKADSKTGGAASAVGGFLKK